MAQVGSKADHEKEQKMRRRVAAFVGDDAAVKQMFAEEISAAVRGAFRQAKDLLFPGWESGKGSTEN